MYLLSNSQVILHLQNGQEGVRQKTGILLNTMLPVSSTAQNKSFFRATTYFYEFGIFY